MNIIILGVGSLGSNLGANLACDLREEKDLQITLVDFDKVEDRNILPGTQYFFQDQVGQFKAEALRLNIYRLCKIKTEAVVRKLENASDIPVKLGDTLYVDCFDNNEARKMVTDWIKRMDDGIDCVHVGFTPDFMAEIDWNENYEVPKDMKESYDICELVGARSFVNYVSGLASSVIQDWINVGVKRSMVIDQFSVRTFSVVRSK